ncbi:MAG: LLM class flavin-dependent oxidoreductase [Candidatus Thorarchaeota archaeon]|nr:LLM class flavin-dependent oxidoreductase [Candidatus Thorarchaeota archaeon]
MTEYTVSLGVTTGMNVRATTWIAENADRVGAHSIWIGEDVGRGQDIIVLTTATLTKSRNVRVGTGIVPITTHGLVELARATATLYDLAPKRFVFGIGVGGIQDLQRKGIRIERPVTLLRKATESLRQLWNGEESSLVMPPIRLENERLGRKTPAKIPIFFGVRGPQMLRLAGEIADGVILSGPKQYLKWAIKRVQNSAREIGRERDSVEIVIWNPIILMTQNENQDLARKIVAIILSDTPDDIVNLLKLDTERVNAIRQAVRESGPDKGADIVDPTLVDMFCTTGASEEVIAQFDEMARWGASEIVVGPPFTGMWRGTVEDLFSTIARSERS